MGGTKKSSLTQIEKQQRLKTEKQSKTKKEKRSTRRTKEATQQNSKDIIKDLNELANIKALTPYTVASKYDVKLSDAKNILKTLEKRKTIQLVASSRGLKIYRFTSNAASKAS